MHILINPDGEWRSNPEASTKDHDTEDADMNEVSGIKYYIEVLMFHLICIVLLISHISKISMSY